MNDKIMLYHNCVKVQEANITKEPKELVFESASKFYLAQAGNSKDKFEVSLITIVRSSFLKFCHGSSNLNLAILIVIWLIRVKSLIRPILKLFWYHFNFLVFLRQKFKQPRVIIITLLLMREVLMFRSMLSDIFIYQIKFPTLGASKRNFPFAQVTGIFSETHFGNDIKRLKFDSFRAKTIRKQFSIEGRYSKFF